MHCIVSRAKFDKGKSSIGRIRYREVSFFVDFVLDFFHDVYLSESGIEGRGKGEQQLGDGGGRFEATESPSWSL